MRFDQLAQMAGGELHNPAMVGRMFSGVSIDSRTIRPGELFVAIRGENQDGHKYIPQAIANGAAGLLSETGHTQLDTIPHDLPVVAVRNCHEGMMLLAENHRLSLDTKMIGITGSNGKTTTKEWTYQLLQAAEPRAYRSPGNWNNLFGMPLAIFAMPDNTRFAVMEMGISKPGEMTRLTRIVQPNLIVILNVGPSHLEYLGSVTGVARAKLEMVSASDDRVPVILNGDDQTLIAEARKIRGDFITFSLERDATFKPDSIEPTENGLLVTIEGRPFNLAYTGRHHVYNLLAAYAAAKTVGVDLDSIDTTAIRFESEQMRGEVVERDRISFVVDCYNANPESVKQALTTFAEQSWSGRKIAIIGDMLELGNDAPVYHRAVGHQIAKLGVDLLITVGPASRDIAATAITDGIDTSAVIQFDDAGQAAKAIRSILTDGDKVLLKASRGIGLEIILELFSDKEGEA